MSSVAEIVADVRERGDAAVREWAERLDGAAPARAEAAGHVPLDALLTLADAVRRWHALQRPADVWRLLPRLEAAGASSILLVPVERMVS